MKASSPQGTWTENQESAQNRDTCTKVDTQRNEWLVHRNTPKVDTHGSPHTCALMGSKTHEDWMHTQGVHTPHLEGLPSPSPQAGGIRRACMGASKPAGNSQGKSVDACSLAPIGVGHVFLRP